MFPILTRAAGRLFARHPSPRDALAEFAAAARDPLVLPRLAELQRQAGSGPLAVPLAAALNLYACSPPGRRQFHANEVLADAADEPSEGRFDVDDDETRLPDPIDCWFRLDGEYGPQPVDGPGGPAVSLPVAAERSGWSERSLRELWVVIFRVTNGFTDNGGPRRPFLTPSDRMRFRLDRGDAIPVMPTEDEPAAVGFGEACDESDRAGDELVRLWRTAAGEGGGGGPTGGESPAAATQATANTHPGLRVRVLAFTLPVVITAPGDCKDEDGETAQSIVDLNGRHLFIDGSVPAGERLRPLLHCIWRGWRLMVGPPADVYAEAELFAVAAEAVIEDLVAQGGVATLMALEPEPVAAGKGADHA